MKLLPRKQDIDKAQANERKREIDYGVNLAKKIDALRETRLEEEAKLTEWRDFATTEVQQEIRTLVEQKNTLIAENKQLYEVREDLIKPLDQEWKELHTAREEFDIKEQNFLNRMELFKDSEVEFEKQIKEVALFTKQLEQRETEISEKESSINPLHKLAEKRLDEIREIELKHAEEYQNKNRELENLKKEYESGIKVNELIEKRLDEREQELIIRENRLATRQKALGIAEQEINKNGNR